MRSSGKQRGTEEVRVAISGDLNKYLNVLVERGLFTSKAELTRFAIIEYLKGLPPSLPSSIQLKAPVSTPSQVFSPEGRIFQIEYAMEAVNRGAPAIGALCDEGVVLAKFVSVQPLANLDEFGTYGYSKVDEHIAMVCCGMAADFNIIHLRAVKEAKEKSKKREKLRVRELISLLSAYVQSFTQKIDQRPLGVNVLLGGVDETGPHLFALHPSGAYVPVKGQAIGEAAADINKNLAKKYRPNISLHDLEVFVAKAFQTIPKKTITPEQVKMALIPTETGLVKELDLKEREALWKKAKR